MKTQNNFRFQAILKFILILPMIILVLLAFTSCASKKKMAIVTDLTGDDTPFVVVEEMPLFPGGDSSLLAFIANNTKYPEQAKANNIQGRVIVRFCVTKEGGVDRISVLKGVNPELDQEASNVVKSLPAFKPGKQGGKAVNVWYMVPISFALENKSNVPPPPPPPPLVPSADSAYVQVDDMPVFTDGDTALLSFIAKNTTYPEEAKKNNIQGEVIVRFVVEKDCTVSNVEIVQGVNQLLNVEALRVVSSLPKFEKPALKAGEPVRVYFMLPISFTLR